MSVLLFFMAYTVFPGFRDFMLAQDMKALTAIQLWRVVGFTMLGVYALDGLPALFTLPVGLGDVAVGLVAIIVLARLVREPAFATSSAMV